MKVKKRESSGDADLAACCTGMRKKSGNSDPGPLCVLKEKTHWMSKRKKLTIHFEFALILSEQGPRVPTVYQVFLRGKKRELPLYLHGTK